MSVEVSTIPSPDEIERNKTTNGGWTRQVLSSWGVPWPPPEGWKKTLEDVYKRGFTVGVVLECVGCRKAEYFTEYEDFPVCAECRKWEEEKYERDRQSIRPIRQNKNRQNYQKEKIPTDFRWAIFERDNFTCRHCGSRRNLSVDHIIPESKGGELTMENCQTLCKKCNSKKGRS
jgi:5-methylcytosine-specific restriction endonuclease McrA